MPELGKLHSSEDSSYLGMQVSDTYAWQRGGHSPHLLHRELQLVTADDVRVRGDESVGGDVGCAPNLQRYARSQWRLMRCFTANTGTCVRMSVLHVCMWSHRRLEHLSPDTEAACVLH
jgi:hypothetical protein